MIWFTFFMVFAESFTSSPFASFLVSVLIATVAIAAAIIAFVAWRSQVTRKKLLLSIMSRSRLMSVPTSMRDDLEILYQGNQLNQDPHVVAIELANVGKSPVKSDDFDRQRALSFGLDVPIIKVLSTEHAPRSAPEPTVTAVDDSFELSPELIAKGEIIKIAMLTEGRPNKVDTKFKPFGDVDVEIRDREVWIARRERRRLQASVAALIPVMALVASLFIYLNEQEYNLVSNNNQIKVGLACESIIQGLTDFTAVIQEASPAIVTSGKTLSGNALFLIEGADAEADALLGVYNEAVDSGITLGNGIAMRTKIQDAARILSDFPTEAGPSQTAAYDRLFKIQQAISGTAGIPSECKKLNGGISTGTI
jgi:hypothetical protein